MKSSSFLFLFFKYLFYDGGGGGDAVSRSLSRRILLLLCYGHFLCSTSCKLQTGQDERKRRKQHVYIESAAGACNDRGREPL